MKNQVSIILNSTLGLLSMLMFGSVSAQSDTANWPSQNLNIENSRYSTLDQINTSNVEQLNMLWSFEPGLRDDIAQVTPLVVDGVMYLHSRATMYALDATTGEELWRRILDSGPANGPVRVSTYAEGRVYAYRGADLYAFDAETGAALASFGDAGFLKVVAQGLHHQYPDTYPADIDPITIGYRLTTTPTFHDGIIYVAAALS